METKKDENLVQVTNENCGPLSVRYLDIISSQNKVVIKLLQDIVGVIGKIPAVDIPVKTEEQDGKQNR